MEELLQEARSLPPVKGRAVAAVLGAIVANAASQPLHWIYNDMTMASVLSSNPEEPEFMTPSHNPYYRIETGLQSNYGDEMLVTLRSIADCKGLNIDHFCDEFVKTFGEGTKYHELSSQGMRGKKPINGPWSNRSMIRFVTKFYTTGKTARDVKNDDQDDPDMFARGLPLLLLNGGNSVSYSDVREFTSLMQSSDKSLETMDAAYKLAELYITNGEKEGEDNVKKLIDMLNASPAENKFILSILNEAHGSQSTSIKDATKNFGKGCSIPGSFQASLRAVLNDKGYTETVREVIRSGGDICSRLHTVGFCLGAKYGIDSIPRSWIDKTFAAEEGLRLALQIVKMS
ncbi:PREDICTED: crystallin J1A-like isoform X2 [Amphimedon queenslandica]|uniref:Uncharacterized protein n=1 Tax=Amphimedon queenslandica TaxID=400682 RepID=A0A1X7VEL3_AMPQE|nr:PREDICTED: crystallin J1A-like isoform X2 [Amphimedon queenslandica]|eukprot:XP_011402420.2 PREDICTED: crystallin J1A-like isoform X2 [Amphimedon queenslandica]